MQENTALMKVFMDNRGLIFQKPANSMFPKVASGRVIRKENWRCSSRCKKLGKPGLSLNHLSKSRKPVYRRLYGQWFFQQLTRNLPYTHHFPNDYKNLGADLQYDFCPTYTHKDHGPYSWVLPPERTAFGKKKKRKMLLLAHQFPESESEYYNLIVIPFVSLVYIMPSECHCR